MLNRILTHWLQKTVGSRESPCWLHPCPTLGLPVHHTLTTEPGVLCCKQTLVKPGDSELDSMAEGLFLLFPEYLTIVLDCFAWLVLAFLRLLLYDSNRPGTYCVARASFSCCLLVSHLCLHTETEGRISTPAYTYFLLCWHNTCPHLRHRSDLSLLTMCSPLFSVIHWLQCKQCDYTLTLQFLLGTITSPSFKVHSQMKLIPDLTNHRKKMSRNKIPTL